MTTLGSRLRVAGCAERHSGRERSSPDAALM
jgi:hypothetical protein